MVDKPGMNENISETGKGSWIENLDETIHLINQHAQALPDFAVNQRHFTP